MKLLTSLALLACSLSVQAQIAQDNSATGAYNVNFQHLAIDLNIDNILIAGGVGFAERFLGQTALDSGGFDQLVGSPSGPLALQAGPAGKNLQTASGDAVIVSLGGIGSGGFGSPGAFANGSMAVLFSADQSEILLYVDGFGGTGHFDFFRRDGSLIQTFALSPLNQQPYGFKRDGGVHDIAGFSLWGTDEPGISLEYIRHDVASAVPWPPSFALMLLGLAGLAPVGRRLFRPEVSPPWRNHGPVDSGDCSAGNACPMPSRGAASFLAVDDLRHQLGVSGMVHALRPLRMLR